MTTKSLVGKHTPGPWESRDRLVTFQDNNDIEHLICECETSNDAALIAAAPMMLEALKRLVQIVDPVLSKTISKDFPMVDNLLETYLIKPVKQAREAIAKAEGR